MHLEVLRVGHYSTRRPPLLFVHGAYSGAWVWAEHYLPYFAEQGWYCVALSLSGHGGSEGWDRLAWLGLPDYVADVEQVAATLPYPPVVIGHSMGGLIAQHFVKNHPSAGLVMLCSVGPGGLGASLAHLTTQNPDILWQLGVMQAQGAAAVDFSVLRRGLFSASFPEQQAMAFATRFQQESARINSDLMLPHFWSLWPRPKIPALVLGGGKDALIPSSDLVAAATFWNADMHILPDAAHCPMLDDQWQISADHVLRWLAPLIQTGGNRDQGTTGW